jgi:hypothetical protein
VRAAWLAGRLGKVFLPLYRKRFAAGADPFNFLESGWGLVAMGLRHAPLRGDAVRALKAPPAPGAPEIDYTRLMRARFVEIADMIDSSEEGEIVEMARGLGRQRVVEATAHLAEDSRYRFRDPGDVPDELALPTLLEMPFHTLDPQQGFPMTMGAVLASARLGAEELYFPAPFLHARGPEDLGVWGNRLVEIQRAILVSSPVRHEGPRVGRNDPCPCGSGKKYKKCHGG